MLLKVLLYGAFFTLGYNLSTNFYSGVLTLFTADVVYVLIASPPKTIPDEDSDDS